MVTLARVQFGLTAGLHFLFVALTLGLVTLVVILQTRALMARDGAKRAQLERMTRFWGQLYVINYAVGIATGLVMEFQLGLNWGGLSALTGDVFGAPLAMETLIAFFLESTLLGMWIFGWGRLNRTVHTMLLWGVAITAYLSAFWVLVANSFLQHPVGYEMRAGRARLTDFSAVLTNPNLGFALLHTISASLVVGGVVMAGISAFHLARQTREADFFKRSLRLGLITGALAATFTVGFGFAQYSYLDNQPTKIGDSDADLARAQADFVARYGPGDYLPPRIVPVSLAFMILIGLLLFLVLIALTFLLVGDLLVKSRALLWGVVALMPVPFVAVLLGWIVREIGRQPWAVYGVLRTSDAVSHHSAGVLTASLIGSVALLLGLAVLDWRLLSRAAMRGPADEFVARGEFVARRPEAAA